MIIKLFRVLGDLKEGPEIPSFSCPYLVSDFVKYGCKFWVQLLLGTDIGCGFWIKNQFQIVCRVLMLVLDSI
jgi:hypothetical protein